MPQFLLYSFRFGTANKASPPLLRKCLQLVVPPPECLNTSISKNTVFPVLRFRVLFGGLKPYLLGVCMPPVSLLHR